MCIHSIKSLQVFCVQVCYVPLIRARTQALPMLLPQCSAQNYSTYLQTVIYIPSPALAPRTDLMCLQFNELYAHCFRTEESVLLKHRKRPISKRLLENYVFERLYASPKSQRTTALYLWVNNEEAMRPSVKGHGASVLDSG